jgi:large-conductance mechanosensitive channel
MTDYLGNNINDNISDIYDNTNHVLSYEINQFYKFIIDNKIFQIGIAFVVSNQVTDVFGRLMKDIVSPILAKLIGSEEEKLEHVTIKIYGMKFGIGNFILGLLHFAIVLLILFYLVRLLPENVILGKNI